MNTVKPLIVATLLSFALHSPHVVAGSDRWIMAITAEHAAMQDLVHIYFKAPDGSAVESDGLKVMAIDANQCAASDHYQMVTDYKLGYGPDRGPVGIYLMPTSWHDRTVCFHVPGVGQVSHDFSSSVRGQSLELKLSH